MASHWPQYAPLSTTVGSASVSRYAHSAPPSERFSARSSNSRMTAYASSGSNSSVVSLYRYIGGSGTRVISQMKYR